MIEFDLDIPSLTQDCIQMKISFENVRILNNWSMTD